MEVGPSDAPAFSGAGAYLRLIFSKDARMLTQFLPSRIRISP
jgi:hypothetical protein